MLTAAFLISWLAPFTANADHAWEPIRQEDGITVWRAEVEGDRIVTFRSRTIIQSPLIEVFTVVFDVDHRCEWQARCAEARIIKWISSREAIGYYRIHGVGPVSDRDAVFRGSSEVRPDEGLIQVNFQQVDWPGYPPIEDAVRMPMLKGFWRLRKLGDAVTEVTYQAQADPGGWIPSWVTNLASKGLPYQALINLRGYIRDGGHRARIAEVEKLGDWSAFVSQAPGG